MLRTIAAAAVAAPAALAVAQVQVDPALPTYRPVSGVSGSLKSVGSDTLNNLMTLWAETFNGFYPNVSIEIEGKGSSTAPPALIEGQSQFGPMSRAMKSSEVDAFEARYGYKPTPLRVAVDALAVFVHKDNPIESLSLDQVAEIFSVEGPRTMTWGDLGLTGEWANKPISLYGRNSASGTYGYFKKVALGNADYKPTVKEQPGSSSVVQGVATDKFAIGYSGIGYKTADVRAVPLAFETGDEAFPAVADYAYSGDYPLARFLYVYINHRPGSTLDPLRREFIRMIYSRQGQEVTIKDGYFPVSAGIAREDLTNIGERAGF
ncbi:MAG: phosphate ABC transporter substrate-binding protein [Planctomycetota bacterium]|nr:MAG: phosphate ABC transporter substrate-binding protein [Planctomycetota bacterium]